LVSNNSGQVGADVAGPPNGAEREAPSQLIPLTDASSVDLLRRLFDDVSDLADRQIELAKQEVAETRDQAIDLAKTFGIGAGIIALVALLLVIWAWTGFIWLFNWIGAFFGFGGLGWVLGLVLPLLAAFVSYKFFIQPGIQQVQGFTPLARTRATLQENLEWARQLRTPRTR
jgi:Putative Actinobacterial Holin-X, holin superfamily III